MGVAIVSLCLPQRTRELSVRRKLNAMPAVFKGKNVLLVDDSIVRGTTMNQIVAMVRGAGADKVGLICHIIRVMMRVFRRGCILRNSAASCLAKG